MKSVSARQPRPRSASGREAAARPRLVRPGFTVSLAELMDCLHEITDDDRLVVAVVADMMERGRLRAPVSRGAARSWAAA